MNFALKYLYRTATRAWLPSWGFHTTNPGSLSPLYNYRLCLSTDGFILDPLGRPERDCRLGSFTFHAV